MDDLAIKVSNVTKVFKLPHEKNTSVKSSFINSVKFGKKGYELQRALDDVSFEVSKGEFFGIIGRNGSGKSTLLKILAGIYEPSSGKIEVNGSLTPFIELGVGFNHELTGRENVFLNGALLGFSRKEMNNMYDDIVEFAELKRFMDQKLKNYSSGMQVRLAFSIAIRARTDILLIDEVLAVGDLAFQEKCYQYFDEIKQTGKTVIFVSHDSGAVERFCDRVIIIDKAKTAGIGSPTEMVLKYGATIAEEQMSKQDKDVEAKAKKIKGRLRIEDVIVKDKDGQTTSSLAFGEPFSIEVVYKLNKKIADEVIVGIDIIDANKDLSLLGPNSREARTIFKLGASGVFCADFPSNPLSPKIYSLTAGIFNKEETFAYDLVENIRQFKIIGNPRHGSIYIQPKWSLKQTKKAKYNSKND